MLSGDGNEAHHAASLFGVGRWTAWGQIQLGIQLSENHCRQYSQVSVVQLLPSAIPRKNLPSFLTSVDTRAREIPRSTA